MDDLQVGKYYVIDPNNKPVAGPFVNESLAAISLRVGGGQRIAKARIHPSTGKTYLQMVLPLKQKRFRG